MEEITYRKAGVDIDEGDRLVRLIAPLARSTFRPEVLADIGSFSALFRLEAGKYQEPVLVSGTDGVGTKLKIAFLADRHDTVGIDLVAMCVNDILACGAEPLFFLDYFATGRLKPEKAALVIKGIAEGCREAGCSLIGGETAEMPGFYADDEYDLSGFAVGVVEKRKVIDGSAVSEGDSVVGLLSNGLHSNGYSLVRKVLFDHNGLNIMTYLPELGTTVGEELLRPTRIYVKAFNALKERIEIRAMAHITGGGIQGNLPRVLPEGMGALISEGAWQIPPVFEYIRKAGPVPIEDMKKTFNMGIGYIMVIPKSAATEAVRLLRESNYAAFIIGSIIKGKKEVVYEQS